MITPPDRTRTYLVEEIETRHPDGSTTIHRKRIRASSEQRSYQEQADQSQIIEMPQLRGGKESGQQ